jgi:methionine-rich copper-binding protein CopC
MKVLMVIALVLFESSASAHSRIKSIDIETGKEHLRIKIEFSNPVESKFSQLTVRNSLGKIENVVIAKETDITKEILIELPANSGKEFLVESNVLSVDGHRSREERKVKME